MGVILFVFFDVNYWVFFVYCYVEIVREGFFKMNCSFLYVKMLLLMLIMMNILVVY